MRIVVFLLKKIKLMILFFHLKKINKYSYKFVYQSILKKDYSSWKPENRR
jgi:hypothetical protein